MTRDSDRRVEAQVLREWLGFLERPIEIASAVAQARNAFLLLENWRTFLSAAFPVRGRSEGALTFELRNGTKFEIPNLRGRRLLRSTLILALREVWLDHVYNPPGFGPSESWTTVDLGANVGFFTVLASLASPRGRIVSVEPVKTMAEFLRRNVEFNCPGNVELCEKGVLDKTCSLPMWVHAINVGGHSIFKPEIQKDVEPRMTSFISLAELFSEYGIDHVDLLKLDVEGAEFPIVMGSGREQFEKIDHISMEYHLSPERRLEDLVAALHDRRFHCKLQIYDSARGMIWATRG